MGVVAIGLGLTIKELSTTLSTDLVDKVGVNLAVPY